MRGNGEPLWGKVVPVIVAPLTLITLKRFLFISVLSVEDTYNTTIQYIIMCNKEQDPAECIRFKDKRWGSLCVAYVHILIRARVLK
jgi:hypothetical protein